MGEVIRPNRCTSCPNSPHPVCTQGELAALAVPLLPAVADLWEPNPDFWRDRPVAVTGATGFLGSHLTSLLVDVGAAVVVLVRDDVPAVADLGAMGATQVTVVSGAVEDQAVVERMLGDYEVRTVFHLAAQSQVGVANRNPVATYEANIPGTWAVLEAVRRSPRVEQVVTASSDKAYGDQPAAPLRRGHAAARRQPLRRVEGVRRPHLAELPPAPSACRCASRGAATSSGPATATGSASCRAPSARCCAASGP